MSESGFLFFYLFFSEFLARFDYKRNFRNFLSRVEYERNSGLKFFTLFLGLFQPVLDRNNAGINFFIFFLYFFAIFFGIFLLGSSMNGIWE